MAADAVTDLPPGFTLDSEKPVKRSPAEDKLAVLARLSRQVVSIERLKPLHDKAVDTLARLQVPGLKLIHGDGRLGDAVAAPYDAIIAAAGGEDLPPAWLAQLAPGGRLVAGAPVGHRRAGDGDRSRAGRA